MENAKVIEIAVSAIVYLAPFVGLIWKISKADSEIKNNTLKINEIEKFNSQHIKDFNAFPFYLEKITTLEKKITTMTEKYEAVNQELNKMEVNLASLVSKIDTLLGYIKKG